MTSPQTHENETLAASEHPAVRDYAAHVNPAFVKLLGMFGYGRVFERAKGSWVWDHTGQRYLDALAGFGALNLGHNHPRLAERVRQFLGEDPLNLVHVGPNIHEAALAKRLADLAPGDLDVCLFASSGAEGVEAGLKLALAATRRQGFVYCEGSFHGTNLGTLSVMGAPRMRAPFEPLRPGCQQVPFGDLAALQEALAKKPAAFVVEPILGEGGVVLPPSGYLAEAQRLCTKAGTLLVLDEVQTGVGRTGTFFACEQEGLVPDVLVLGKSLGGGLVPISAAITTARLAKKAYGSMDRFDLHSSTFGGNALACALALETIDATQDLGLCAAAAAQGERLLAGLRARLEGHPFVKDIRGRGLLVALELGPSPSAASLTGKLAPGLVKLLSKQVFGQWAALKLLERGVICQPASQQWNVLKLEPALTIEPAEVAALIDHVCGVLQEYRGLTKLLTDVSARLGKQLLAGWSF